MKNILIILLFFTTTFFACKKDQINGDTKTNAALADSLRLSPSSLQIENDSLFLTAYVWRNFMPSIGKDGSGLYCSNQLIYKDSLSIPPGLVLKTQYVINQNQVWTNPNPVVNQEQSFVITGVVNNGPKWGPDILVDIVCEFEINNRIYKIIARQQKINAIY